MKQIKEKLPSGLHALLWKEEKWYVAKCIEVDVASQGKTKREALSNLQEALALFFNEESLPKPPVFPEIELHHISSSYA